MQESKYIQLIHKKITGVINAEEHSALTHWIEASPNHQKIYADVERAWELSHHYEKSFTPNVDLALLDLKKRIRKATPTAPNDASKATSPKTAPVKTLRPRNTWYRYAVAASVAVLVGLGIWSAVSPPNLFDQQASRIATEEATGFIELEDGTKVWLNKNSSLVYRKEFASNQRLVKLEGEAFFEVAKESSRYFIIETANTKVKVLGTSFNVSAYRGQAETSVLVKTGKVRFENLEGQTSVELVANDKANYTHHTKQFTTLNKQSLNGIAWMSKQLNFNNTRFADVVKDLENYYAIDIDWQDSDLADCPYTSLFNDSSLDDIWSALETAFQLKVERQNNNSFKIVGGSCK